MPINFFDEACKTTSNLSLFGLCDDPPQTKNPAYIDEYDNSKWIATVKNSSNKIVNFFAIDNCIVMLRPNGQLESRCEGVLQHETNLKFIELKDRDSSGWLGKSRNQLKITYAEFCRNHDVSKFTNIVAYASNKQRPSSNNSYATVKREFKDETGLILEVKSTIEIF